MTHVDPVKRQCFSDIFCAEMKDISKGLSPIRDASSDGHWTTWSNFCGDVDLDPLPFSYQYLVLVLNTFSQQ